MNLRKRFYLICNVAEEFKKELDAFYNIKHVHVTSAIELNNDKKDEIKNKLAEKLNANVDIDWGIDSDIIAGLILNIDETIIDNSIRHKLDDLSKSIAVS
jgi:F-type H+-transporting ATPase subunit delta